MGATGSEGIARGDAELISAAREGDAAAFGLLYERHAGATWAVARQYTNSAADAEDVVAEAFTKVFAILKGGGGPDVAFRAYIFTTARRLGMQRVQAGNRTQPTDDVQVLEAALEPESSTEAPALADFERGVVGRAYSTLPERWQAVLWYTEVESLSPAKIGPLLGLSANGVAALAYRAREGLRQAYLQQHLQDPLDSGCRTIAGKLGAYVRGGLATRETAQVDGHLEGCGDCRALLLELGDVNHGMRGVIAPLVLGALGLGALAQPLPVGGGLAAGFAALGMAPATTTTGAAAGTGSAAAPGSATASGTTASGTTTGSATASGAGTTGATSASGGMASAAGASATAVSATAAGAGAATAGGAAAVGIGGLLASLPLAVIGIAASVVVVTAVAAAGVLGVFSSEAPPDTASDVATTSTREPTAAESPATRPAAPGSPAPGDEPPAAVPEPPPAQPTTSPDAVMTPVAIPPAIAGPVAPPAAGTSEPPFEAPPTGASSEPDIEPTADETASPTPTPTSAPTPTATPTPTPAPTRTPAPTPEPTYLPAQITLPAAAGPVVLIADGAEHVIGVQIENTGGVAATGLRAQVQLPHGAVLASSRVQLAVSSDGRAPAPPSVVARRFAVGGTSQWVCAGESGSDSAECALDRLPAGSTAVLTLRVVVDESALGATDAAVAIQVTGDELTPMRLRAPVVVHRQARLEMRAPESLDVIEGQTRQFLVTVANRGDVRARAVEVRVAAPAGVEWSGTGDGVAAGWVCSPEAASLLCAHEGIEPGAQAPLALAVRSSATAEPGPIDGAVQVSASAPGAQSGQASVGVTVRGSRLGFGAPPLARLVDGRDGRVTFSVLNSGNHPAGGVVAHLTLPRHVVADGTPADDSRGECTAVSPTVVRCELDTVAPGQEQPVVLGVKAIAAGAGEVTVRLSGGTGGDVTAKAPAEAASGGLAPRFSRTGGWTATQVGAPLLACLGAPGTGWPIPDPGCTRAGAGLGTALDNNDHLMVPLNGAGGHRVSSTTRLDIPAHQEVAFAGLYWSANRSRIDQFTGDLTTARLRGPGERSYTDITGEVLIQTQDDGRRVYYQSFADVTAQVRAAGPGQWSVADIAIASPRLDLSPTYYAGWSLVVVYAEPGAGDVTVYDGGAWVGGAQQASAFAFSAEPGATARIGVVAWEGDRGVSGDALLLDGSALTPWRWSGAALTATGSATNAFDSTATGWSMANSMGVDAKRFQDVVLTQPLSTLTATTTGDAYLIGVLTVQTRTG